MHGSGIDAVHHAGAHAVRHAWGHARQLANATRLFDVKKDGLIVCLDPPNRTSCIVYQEERLSAESHVFPFITACTMGV